MDSVQLKPMKDYVHLRSLEGISEEHADPRRQGSLLPSPVQSKCVPQSTVFPGATSSLEVSEEPLTNIGSPIEDGRFAVEQLSQHKYASQTHDDSQESSLPSVVWDFLEMFDET